MKRLSEIDLANKKYIIFDMDGTLIDSIGIWNNTDYQLIKQLSGKDINLDIIQQERDNFLAQNTGADVYLEYCNYLITKYNLNITMDELLNLRWQISGHILLNEEDFKPGVVDLIKSLKEQGFILVLATATTEKQIDIYCNKNQKMINQLSIKDYFDLIIKKEDVTHKKPHPEIYLYILNYYKCSKEECLVFEDSLHGIIAAKEAGIETINVYDKYSDKDRESINELTDYSLLNYQEFSSILSNKKMCK